MVESSLPKLRVNARTVHRRSASLKPFSFLCGSETSGSSKTSRARGDAHAKLGAVLIAFVVGTTVADAQCAADPSDAQVRDQIIQESIAAY